MRFVALRENVSVFATTARRGLSLSRCDQIKKQIERIDLLIQGSENHSAVAAG
jgi:hypothetical protein